MIKRIRWKTQELIKVGMELDRLMVDPITKLIPPGELLRIHAQKVLPTERQREMSLSEADSVVARIDAMREKQAVEEFLGNEIAAPFADLLPTDSEEVKRLAALTARIDRLENALMQKIDQQVQLSVKVVVEQLMTKMRHQMASDLIDIFGDIAQVKHVERTKQARDVKIAVVYPQEATWAGNVVSGLKSLRHERLYASPIAIGDDNAENRQLSDFDHILVIDSASESAAAGVAMHRVVRVCSKQQIDINKVLQLRCATKQQMMAHVKSNLQTLHCTVVSAG